MSEASFALPRHPLGVKPAGNALTATVRGARPVQKPLPTIPDEILLAILEFLDVASLLALGATCKALYAFSRFDDLWRTRCIEYSASLVPRKWNGTWYRSYFQIPRSKAVAVSVEGLASDALYRPFLCANTPLAPYISRIPAANAISRLSDLTFSDFNSKWVDKPFILTEPVKKWPVFRDWEVDGLLQTYKDVVFRAEAVDWPLLTYVEYMRDNSDESPLYLFDRSFVEKMGLSASKNGDYWAPECFGEDLFAVLEEQRPDSRWLIVGPERSGSTFHKDPNATSAWNAVLHGSKYWIMFPSGHHQPPPPGVYVSADQSEVTSPLSIAEWLLGFHKEARKTPGCIEGICNEGEVLHVPSGWWHLVVNIEPSIAITQNFVPEAHLVEVMRFLRDKPDQISGFKREVNDAFGMFKVALERAHPELANRAREEMERPVNQKKRKWEELVRGHKGDGSTDEAPSAGFSFGFAGEDDKDQEEYGEEEQERDET